MQTKRYRTIRLAAIRWGLALPFLHADDGLDK